VIQQSLVLRAWIYTDQGDFPHAAAMLSEVEPRLRRRFPPRHLALGSFASYQSMLAAARGDLPSALQLANEALSTVEAWFKTHGSDDRFVAILLTRRADVEFQSGRVDEAVADAERASRLSRSDVPPGAFLSTAGRADLMLGRALQAKGRGDEARAAVRSALEHLQSSLGLEHPDTQSARRFLALETSGRSK
jgi:tetratricopeptide (TPR) repeat protein